MILISFSSIGGSVAIVNVWDRIVDRIGTFCWMTIMTRLWDPQKCTTFEFKSCIGGATTTCKPDQVYYISIFHFFNNVVVIEKSLVALFRLHRQLLVPSIASCGWSVNWPVIQTVVCPAVTVCPAGFYIWLQFFLAFGNISWFPRWLFRCSSL